MTYIDGRLLFPPVLKLGSQIKNILGEQSFYAQRRLSANASTLAIKRLSIGSLEQVTLTNVTTDAVRLIIDSIDPPFPQHPYPPPIRDTHHLP